MNNNPPYNGAPQYQHPQARVASPLGTPQQQHAAPSPQFEARRQKRHYPRIQSPDVPTANHPQPPQPNPHSRTASPFQQQQQFQQFQHPPAFQQPQQFQQPAYASPTPPPPQPNGYTQNYDQTLNGMASMHLHQQPSRQDVALVGQPALIEDLRHETSTPEIPPNYTATGSPHAQVNGCFNHSTVNAFPFNNALLKKSKLALGLVLQPYLSDKVQKTEIPVVPDTVVTRCSRCKTYINPFVQFTAGALQWKCNMCGMENDVPQAFDWDVISQQHADRYARPELNYGCVDFIAPAEYTIRPPQPPVYVFVLDTSYQAIQTGMLAVVADAILASLDRIPNEDGRTKVAFITADNAVGFHALSGNEAEILVVGDLADMYLPRAASELMVNLVESRAAVEDLLQKMKTMYASTHTPANCLGAALQAARKLLSPTGGKIVCFQGSIPNVGDGTIKTKPDTGNKSVLDLPLMSASVPFYKSFAAECTKSQVCADMFILGDAVDVATLNVIPRFTGGQTHVFPGFNATAKPAECLRLKEEVISLLSEQIGLEAVMRTRCSQGIVCHAFFGNCTTRIPDIMALPNVPRDQSYCIELAIEEEIKTQFVHFQTALLYTTCFGERRIRVMNLCLPVTKSISELFASVDQVAMARLLCHQATDKGANGKLRDGRDHLSKQAVDICGAYGKEVLGISSANAQLSVCRPMSLLPLLVLGVLKSPAFQDAPVPVDMRSQSAILLRTLPTTAWLNFVHPNFYSIHNMPQLAGTLDATTGQCIMPPPLHLSSEKIEAHGCYLLEDGQSIYVWIGKHAVPQLCKDLLGVTSINEVTSGQVPMLPHAKSPISERLEKIVKHLQTDRQVTYYPTIYIIREDGDPMLRSRFLSHLIEDRQPTGPTTAGANQQNVSSGMSYFQWLGYIRSKCQ
ncbi:hypothetical protein V8B55DRAFT_1462229 [Mucor lusitanicus]|uniref:Protein transporter SEC24 n=1 Tax=Mucor circinelloides f. lusitanicus TaxID=29924 RepID=A0A8H4BS91_MUCCL|nr:hypothetical protein FB192DRAFT_1353781 [Mucor lusitanicus]